MKRTAYQEQLDSLHVSEQKADETLQLMLKENHRLQAQEQRTPIQRNRIPLYAIAAAACIALLVLGISQLNSRSGIPDVRISSLPKVASIRGGEDSPVSFQEAFGQDAAALFPGWQLTEETTRAVLMNGQEAHEASLRIEKDGKQLSVTVTDIEPPLMTVLKKEEGRAVYVARDNETGMLYAAGIQGRLYVVCAAEGIAEKDFIALAEEVLGK